ncbi:DUF2796 domain-containing protein [Falsihalocynthiibacter sp. SS001]|uniref:zinc uptake protein ZrgA n=1 Tax=Falsihalocynthiibacter sp. SS001 TaxID=3349698 RepID=UPI0036D24F52
MKRSISLIALVALVAAFPAFAENSRQLDAHEHGVGALDIAIEGTSVAMIFKAPGADIVGFEYSAESDADVSAVNAALVALEAPLELFRMPDAANCEVIEAHAELENGEQEAHHDEDRHDDHADEEREEHNDEHEEHEHEDHDPSEDAGHTEFHAEYALNCENTDALAEITFPYFETFPNAQELEVQIIDTTGAQAFEVERDAPVLNLKR